MGLKPSKKDFLYFNKHEYYIYFKRYYLFFQNVYVGTFVSYQIWYALFLKSNRNIMMKFHS